MIAARAAEPVDAGVPASLDVGWFGADPARDGDLANGSSDVLGVGQAWACRQTRLPCLTLLPDMLCRSQLAQLSECRPRCGERPLLIASSCLASLRRAGWGQQPGEHDHVLVLVTDPVVGAQYPFFGKAEGAADGLGSVVAGLDQRLDADEAQLAGQAGQQGDRGPGQPVPAVAGQDPVADGGVAVVPVDPGDGGAANHLLRAAGDDRQRSSPAFGGLGPLTLQPGRAFLWAVGSRDGGDERDVGVAAGFGDRREVSWLPDPERDDVVAAWWQGPQVRRPAAAGCIGAGGDLIAVHGPPVMSDEDD